MSPLQPDPSELEQDEEDEDALPPVDWLVKEAVLPDNPFTTTKVMFTVHNAVGVVRVELQRVRIADVLKQTCTSHSLQSCSCGDIS